MTKETRNPNDEAMTQPARCRHFVIRVSSFVRHSSFVILLSFVIDFMLTIYGKESRFCDGISRRNFLRIGALGLGGLTLPQPLQAEASSGIRSSHKAVIMIYLPGGPPHQDMFDLKMDAPLEIRGEFTPIPTN